jgi:hypothetical protein
MFLTLHVLSQTTINDIDTVVRRIKQKQEHFEVEGSGEDGGNLKSIYYEDSIPRVIMAVEKGEIEKSVSWFFGNNRLIYSETIWMDTRNGKKLYHEKTYHDKRGLIAWMKNEDGFVDARSHEFRELDKQLTAYSLKLLEEAKR